MNCLTVGCRETDEWDAQHLSICCVHLSGENEGWDKRNELQKLYPQRLEYIAFSRKYVRLNSFPVLTVTLHLLSDDNDPYDEST